MMFEIQSRIMFEFEIGVESLKKEIIKKTEMVSLRLGRISSVSAQLPLRPAQLLFPFRSAMPIDRHVGPRGHTLGSAHAPCTTHLWDPLISTSPFLARSRTEAVNAAMDSS